MRRSANSGFFGDSVWGRTGHGNIGARAFVALFNLWVVLGLGASAWCAFLSQGWMPGWWMLLAAIVPFIGIFIAGLSEFPPFSLVGYAMMVGSFGFLLGPVVEQYTEASLVKVILTTGLVSGTLGIVGTLYPKSLESWGSFLFGGLLVLLFGQIFGDIATLAGLPVAGTFTMLDWIGVILFSAYVMFDYNRAMRVERTVDNSIDCALAVYLDIFDLFLYLLPIMGEKDD